jgi:helix-turn-helix protein
MGLWTISYAHDVGRQTVPNNQQPNSQNNMNTSNNASPVLIAPHDEYLNKKAASALLGICVRTLDSYFKKGLLKASKPTHRTLRIRRSEIERMLERTASA